MIKRITRHSYFHYSICLLLVSAFCVRAGAQTFAEPEQEQLLNGLKVVFWQRPGDPNVLVKLRINSGAAFDLAGKEGTMALLGDVLFPDPATREYVTEQLGGQLAVSTNYDGIDVLVSGKASEFERIVELLRSALVTTQLTPENVARVREARIKQLSEKPSAANIADRAIAARLFGNFPYGRSPGGSFESLSKIERADLMLARERFLTADNGTLVVIGGVAKPRVMRTLRQLIGPWQKSDRTVPATFRQPSPPDARVLVVNQSGATTAEVRLAIRGLARSDRDYAAMSILSRIMQARLQAALPEALPNSIMVRHDAHVLPGIFVFGARASAGGAPRINTAVRYVMNSLVSSQPSNTELETTRSEALSELTPQIERIADYWLDIETYKLPSLSTQITSIKSITAADVQHVAIRLFKDASMAAVAVGDAEQLKTSLGSSVELQNEKALIKPAIDRVVPTKRP
ncbi:MAG TPA: insulinase family protein [Pyrinomonadaceae bacterium]|nr:insulinase family protein [Pyrinomonadaceae bacterium]